MNDERYSIIYSSRTGNTRLLAEAIRESLPADLCNHFGTDEAGAIKSESYMLASGPIRELRMKQRLRF